MTALESRIAALAAQQRLGMRRGIEKESLRAQPSGWLALTPHPVALGSALTHPHITTDYSESQVELITGVHNSVDACLDELRAIHQFTCRCLQAEGDEMLWVSSMPSGLPTDETIPLGRYGSSNIGRAKSVYRMGLGHRYGRRMQTISGIHYNWSLPGLNNDDYFGLIRNFRRQAFLLLYLFGASPAVCSTFVEGRQHELQRLSERTLYMPHGTSLRMGKLGYQSDAQATLAVSYNGLEGYADSLHDALTRPWPAYQNLGVQNPGGDYNQLATSLLQIENEFYGTIRPKRTIASGERPLHALRERGVEYIEVRLMDLNPFVDIGIDANTLHFLDVFLLYCALSDSAPDSPEEIREIGTNQHLTAARGREPGLQLQRQGQPVALRDWAQAILRELQPVAQALDQAQGGTAHADAVAHAERAVQDPDRLPSAQVLRAMAEEHDNVFVGFVRAQSQHTQVALLAEPWSAEQQARFEAMSTESLAAQRRIEAADTLPFEAFRQHYVSPDRLGLESVA